MYITLPTLLTKAQSCVAQLTVAQLVTWFVAQMTVDRVTLQAEHSPSSSSSGWLHLCFISFLS